MTAIRRRSLHRRQYDVISMQCARCVYNGAVRSSDARLTSKLQGVHDLAFAMEEIRSVLLYEEVSSFKKIIV